MKVLSLVQTTIRRHLDRCSERERKLITWGGFFVALLIVWFVLITPAFNTVQQAPATQSALLKQASLVLRAAQELDGLRSARSTMQVSENNLQARLQILLEEQGIAEQTSVRRTEEGDLRLDFNQVSASGFLAWLARAENISSLTINGVEIEKVEAGILRGHVTLLPSS